MADQIVPSPEKIRELLRYEPETGRLFWKERPNDMFNLPREHIRWNSRYADKEAFASCQSNGYRIGHIHSRKYYAHRVIWVLIHGDWPRCEIDHINGINGDNRIENLREASKAQNQRNKGMMANNTSGFKGVSWNSRAKKWQALIAKGGKNRNLGQFDTPEAAHAAYCEAAKKYHGEFARTS